MIILVVVLIVIVVAIIAAVLLMGGNRGAPAGYYPGMAGATGPGASGMQGGYPGAGQNYNVNTPGGVASGNTGMGGWCSVGGTYSMAGAEGTTQVTIIGLESHNGAMMCHGRINYNYGEGAGYMDYWWDESGENVDFAMGGMPGY